MVMLQTGSSMFLTFDGSLDAGAVAPLRSALDQLRERAPRRLVIDLASVVRIDASGIALLVSIVRFARESGGLVEVRGLAGQPRRVFEVLGLERALAA